MNTNKVLIAAAAFAAFNANAALTFSQSASYDYLGALSFNSSNANVSSPIAGSITNIRLAPLGLDGDDLYSVITTGGVATMNFATGVSSFSFLWGSPDNYNFLDIATNDASGLTYNGGQLGLLGGFSSNGDNNNTRLFTIGTTDDTLINSITFRSNGVAFEVAAAVPEPGTYALMIAGLAAMRLVTRRRKS